MVDPAKLEALQRRGAQVLPAIEAYRQVDGKRKALQAELDGARAERNGANDRMAAIKDKKSADFAAARDTLRSLSQRIKDGEGELGRLEAETRLAHLMLPNAPHGSVPEGQTEADNQVVSTWGTKPELSFTPRDHVDLGTSLGILDFEAGAKLSGARFTVVKDAGAKLVRALMSFMLETHTARGYREVWPPVLLKRESMEGTGQLPKFEDDAFKTLGEHELFLCPTAEV